MGVVLEPTEQMSPWYEVEVRRESAYVSAKKFMAGYLREHFHQGETTDDERAVVWQPVDDTTVAAPGEPPALAAALEQIAGHSRYQAWRSGGSHAGGAGAELRDGRLLVTAPASHRYGELGAEIVHMEFAYEDVGPILADLWRLTAS
ncbi:hypothetical protein [Streptomyces sulphureus]|uniref:hypothetical protein n=1 Tax=Streptomyces sulphureus TaxID=47758 RepID=UPI000370FA4C|nr:hypothetical protein [Streptomyces sulphureus]